MAIGTTAAILGGASLLGGLASSRASRQAASAQANAAADATNAQLQMFNRSSADQMRMFNQSRADQMPWLNQGKTSLNQLGALMRPGGQLTRNFSMKDFQADPGYRFRLTEGMRTLENSAAARGGLLSGNTLKALSNYGQNSASNEYQNAYNRFTNDQTNIFNRLAALANTGQVTGQQLGSLGASTAGNIGSLSASTAGNIGNNMMTAGAARASGYTGQANALNNGINNGFMLYGANNGWFK